MNNQQKQKNADSALKAVGISLALGTAVAVVSSAAKKNTTKRKAMKVAKKAVNSFSNIVDNVHGLV